MRKLTFILTLFSISSLAQIQVDVPVFASDTVNVVSFGAKADGISLNTTPFEKAIDACHRKGGGTVLVPEGLWLTGPIKLKSNVNLYISQGAVIQFSRNTSDYPMIRTNWEGLDAIRCHPPIYGEGLENIAITGKGILDGSGQVWRPVKKSKVTLPEWQQLVASGGFVNEKSDTWYPTERALNGSRAKRPGVVAEGYTIENAEAIREYLRPNMVVLLRCKRVLLEGITFQNSPAWCLHPLLSQHITIRNIIVRNPWNAQNGDGLDLESCRYVKVDNSTFDVGDDAICIKSGRDEEGRKRGVPTEDVIVQHCTVYHGHGGFVVGSEMSGGARNIFVRDCNFLGTDIGLRFKTTRGRGGIVEKIFIEDIRMNNIGGAAILFDMYYMAKDPLAVFGGEYSPQTEFQPVTEATPQFRDIKIKNVTCSGAETGIFVRGLPEMNVSTIVMENISVRSQRGFECTEADNIVLRNATFNCDGQAIIVTRDSKNLVLDDIRFGKADVFLKIMGDRSKNIQVTNTDTVNASKGVELDKNVSRDVYKIR